jgi:hypothetical protein
MFSYNWTVGLFCPISPSDVKDHLTGKLSPPGYKKNGECTRSDDDLLGVGFGLEAGNDEYSLGLA